MVTRLVAEKPVMESKHQLRPGRSSFISGELKAWGIAYVYSWGYTDKKENQIFLIYKEIQGGAVAKSYMTNGLLIYREIFTHFLIY